MLQKLPDAKYEPVGTDGLQAAVTDKFVSAFGPCNSGHTMSHAAARDLMKWLQENVPAEQS